MTGAGFGAASNDRSAPDGSDRAFEFRDRRRLDPVTGELRDLPQRGSSAAEPANPDNAGQPMTVTAESSELAAARH